MEFKQDRPIYQQIADHFYEKILLEEWKPSQRIPSVRDVAVSLEVNPNTAVRAYEQLQNQGILYNKRGIGYFVADDGYQKTRRIKREAFKTGVLPEIFRQMDLLAIPIDEVRQLYEAYQARKNHISNNNET